MIALAYATSREWLEASAVPDPGLRTAAAFGAAVVYLQLLIGALMRHTGAGLAIPDFPLAFGRLWPSFWDAAVVVHFVHRLGAVCVLGAVVNLAVRGWRSADPRFGRPATLALVLTVGQIALGAATVLSQKAVLPTTAHVASGAAVLGVCFFLALRTFHLTTGIVRPVRAPSDLGPQPASA